jgi:hypothetical protein
MRAHPLLTLLLACALAACLAACGGGGSSGTAAGDTSTITAAPPAFLKHAESTAKTAIERRKAGRAAPFVAPESDNSVPTFGFEAGASERSKAEANLRAYLTARAAHDWPKACTYLATSVKQGYEKLASASARSGAKPTCARILPTLGPIRAGVPANPLTGPLVSLRVHGVNAFALFYGPGHQQYMVPMNREGGEWRPTQAAPIAYPPGAP